MKTAKKNLKYQSPGINEETRYEKLHTVTFENSKEGSVSIAREICELVKAKEEKNKSCVIGFATGSSPTKVYQEIIRIHKEESLSFKNVIAFNSNHYCLLLKFNICYKTTWIQRMLQDTPTSKKTFFMDLTTRWLLQ